MRSYAEIFKNIEKKKKTDVEKIFESIRYEKILSAIFTRALNGDKTRDKKNKSAYANETLSEERKLIARKKRHYGRA